MSPATLRDIDASKLSYVEDQNGQRVPCLATQEFYKTVEPYERTFHMKSALWLNLLVPEKGSVIEGTAKYQFEPGKLAFALWPFDVTRLVFREPIWEKTSPRAVEVMESRAGVIQNLFRRLEATFVRRWAVDSNGDRVQVLSLYSQLQVKGEDGQLLMVTNHDGKKTDYGIMRQAVVVRADGTAAGDVWTYGAKSGFGDDHCTSDPSGALGGLGCFARFATFCDMLTYDRHLVTVRKLERDKRKKISWHSMAVSQPRSNYEIVLRPTVTIYDAGRILGEAHVQRMKIRARPRRHRVGELTGGYTRVRNGKVQFVKPFERGGHLTLDPQPVYNSMPLAKWYAEQGER